MFVVWVAVGPPTATMPAAAKKKGKKKKSKEELEAERLAAEEAERLAREAEEARLAEEKRLAEEELRRKAAEAAAARQAELERLDEEQAAAAPADDAHAAAVVTWDASTQQQEEWGRYRTSHGGFDTSKENQLTAFLSDKVGGGSGGGGYSTLDDGATAVASIVALLGQLRARKAWAFETKDDSGVARALEHCSQFEAAVSRTLDSLMARLVDNAKSLTAGKPEFQQNATTPDLDVGLWMNVVPKGYRPRIVKCVRRSVHSRRAGQRERE